MTLGSCYTCVNLHWLLGSTILVLGSDFHHSHYGELALTPSPDSSPWHCVHLRLTDSGSEGSFHWLEHKARGFIKANKELFVVPLSKLDCGLDPVMSRDLTTLIPHIVASCTGTMPSGLW